MPSIPWVPDAVKRAQNNLRDLGTKRPLPVLTLEDVLISKLLAFQNRATRLKDLADLTSIIETTPSMDNKYLAEKVRALSLTIPKAIEPFIHYSVSRAARAHL